MFKMKNIAFVCVILTGIISGFSSCKSQEDKYEKYIVPNGLIYPGPALNPVAKPGNNRIEIAWERGVDPRVVKARIFWNNYTDSVEVDISRDMEVVSKIISPIAENIYSFMIHTYDANGNKSIPIETMGRVYGQNYANLLGNRILLSEVYDGLDLIINWHTPISTETCTSVRWTDIHGNIQTMDVDPSEDVVTLGEFDYTKVLSYHTVHIPDSLAIDVLHAPVQEKMIDPVSMLPKSSWEVVRFPGDITSVNSSHVLTNMWNGRAGDASAGFHSGPLAGAPLPHMFGWDLGYSAKLKHMKLWPRNDSQDDKWRRGHPKRFEIYGSPDSDPDGTWTLLGRFEIVNPHPEIETPWTDANMLAIAAAGFEFDFVPDEDADPEVVVRYIQFHTLSNFGEDFPQFANSSPDATYTCIQEITFWGIMVRE